jgi:hypothetical protein
MWNSANVEFQISKYECRMTFRRSTFALSQLRTSYFLSFLLYFFLLLTAKADFTIKQRMENAGSVQEITLEIKDTKCRVDASQQSTAIIDSKTGETTVLIRPSKTYMKLAPEQLKAQGDAVKNLLKDQANPPADAALAATGKKETINGFETEEYTATLNGVAITFAIAKDFPNYQKFVSAMYNIQVGPGMESFRSLSLPPDQYPGMPIRTAIEIMGQKVITSLESAVEGPIADSEFSIPGDYKELAPNSK